MYLLRKGAYRDISHIILKHTPSNKLVSKVSAQKKGGESYDSYKYVFKFQWFRCSPLLISYKNALIEDMHYVRLREINLADIWVHMAQ